MHDESYCRLLVTGCPFRPAVAGTSGEAIAVQSPDRLEIMNNTTRPKILSLEQLLKTRVRHRLRGQRTPRFGRTRGGARRPRGAEFWRLRSVRPWRRQQTGLFGTYSPQDPRSPCGRPAPISTKPAPSHRPRKATSAPATTPEPATTCTACEHTFLVDREGAAAHPLGPPNQLGDIGLDGDYLDAVPIPAMNLHSSTPADYPFTPSPLTCGVAEQRKSRSTAVHEPVRPEIHQRMCRRTIRQRFAATMPDPGKNREGPRGGGHTSTAC